MAGPLLVMLIAIENPVPQSLFMIYCAVQPPAATAATAGAATRPTSAPAHASTPANRSAVRRLRRRQVKRFMSFPSARTRRPSERIEQPAWPSLVDAPKTSVLAAATRLVRRGAREDHHDPAFVSCVP